MNKYPDWLDDAVMYHIFPASFYDSNGDGIGDLPGIIQKLDYIQSLGINLIWISPVFDSPFRDGGYDVRDYYKIAPRYGKNSDITRLCKEAGRREMRIMLDLIPGHTSTEHPWFKASASEQKTGFDNRYVWTDHIFRSASEGVFIGGAKPRNGKYMISFFSFQPALNYGWLKPDAPWKLPIHHPDSVATRNELKKIMDFWLKKGVSGFRVDLAGTLIKDDVDCKGAKILYGDLRRWLDKNWPEAVLLSEWSEPGDAIRCGFHMDFILHMAPEFTQLFRMEKDANIIPVNTHEKSFFRKSAGGEILPFFDYLQAQIKQVNGKGLISMPTGNHDLPRISFGRNAEELKVAYGFIFTLPVVPSLYYGDEIGMRHLFDVPNIEGAYVRAGCRTPMQWNRQKNAGFSSAPKKKLYLPQDNAVNRPAVSDQNDITESLLNFVRPLIAVRKQFPALGARGKLEILHAQEKSKAVVYLRSYKNQKIIVVLNPGSRPVTVVLPFTEPMRLHLSAGKIDIRNTGKKTELRLGGISFAIVELKQSSDGNSCKGG